ncbi:ABC transporter substrate-binding protein [Tardiphaga sp. 215_C5_N2_1]|uniref:ABC transporter substrate-binding protein n=1 Tax=Tardiphaga sp. 215_C5_N2_1 TaxID=3240774 RepID=UPI003F899051
MRDYQSLRRSGLPFLLGMAIFNAPTLGAETKYDKGASDREIRIGNTFPYSGPVSAFGVIGKTELAYFQMINDQGGINGRKIKLISYDDAYSPPKAVEQTRRLVESDEVLLIFNTLGTPSNTAIQKYLNTKKVPQLFVATGAAKFNDPQNFPWTMGWSPNTQHEGRIYASYVLEAKPDAKVAVLYQNDEFGRDLLRGFKEALGDRARSAIVIEEGYEVAEPTVDSHVAKIAATGADTLLNFSLPKVAAQTIKKVAELNWKPLHIVPTSSSSVGAVMQPAGIEAAQGIVTSFYVMDGSDPQWVDHPSIRRWNEFLEKYLPGADRSDVGYMYGYAVSQTLRHVLEMCGDELTRENVIRQAANLRSLQIDGLLPGITLNTSPTDYAPIKQLQLSRFKGRKWERFGEVLSIQSGTK